MYNDLIHKVVMNDEFLRKMSYKINMFNIYQLI